MKNKLKWNDKRVSAWNRRGESDGAKEQRKLAVRNLLKKMQEQEQKELRDLCTVL
jgi:hypothetical protein